MASIHAAERCMERFPYLGARFGLRGDAFARTDSGYLTTLIRFPKDYVVDQVQWLARVLSSRGMPRWLMEVHLEVLEAELTKSIPGNRDDHNKLLDAAAGLRSERQSIVSQQAFDALVAEFAQTGGNAIPNFGGLIVSAVCDEICGIDAAVSSITHWLETSSPVPHDDQNAVARLIARTRQIADQHRP